MIDERLEELSDKVRLGIPVSMLEALEVIEYQSEKKTKKKSLSLWSKIKGLFS